MAVEAVRADGRRMGASFRTLSVHESRALLLYGIERRCPVQVVVGRTGSGKSRLLGALARTAIEGAELVLARELPPTLEEMAALLARRLDVVDVAGVSPLERLARLADALAERRRAGRLVALLLDDAHLLPTATLCEVRLLAGAEPSGGALLPIVLAGRPALAERLADPALEPLCLAVSTHIELLRPLPAAVAAPAEPDDEPEAPMPRRRRRWMPAAALGLAAATATTLLAPLLDTTPPTLPAPIRIPAAPAPHAVPAATVAAVPEPAVTVVPSPPAVEDETGGRPVRITADAVRRVVAEFATALDDRDLAHLERLLDRNARQNGVRGRRAVLESYGYRFARLDAPTTIGPPARITLREGNALVDAPFRTSYRDPAGDVGTIDGTVRLRVVLHAGRPVVDTIDYQYASALP